MLRDIAILTGGTIIPRRVGIELREDATMDMLGSARQIKVTMENTTIVDGAGDKQAIANRAAEIAARSSAPPLTSTVKLQERLAKLAGGVAVIRVGAATETEMKGRSSASRMTRTQTPRSLLRKRSVAGGGVAYVNAIAAVELWLPRQPATRRPVCRLLHAVWKHR